MDLTDYGKAVLQWLFILLSNLILVPLGLVVVAIAIPFAVPGESASDGRPILNLPRWARLFGNDFDGLLGDKRGWWAAHTPGGVDPSSFLAKWWWAAIRNPVNNMRVYDLWSCPVASSSISFVGNASVADRKGFDGWQFVKAEKDGRHWYGFYWTRQYAADRMFVVRLGYKINPGFTAGELPKGATFRVNPFKSLS